MEIRELIDIKELIEEDGGMCQGCEHFTSASPFDYPELGNVYMFNKVRQCSYDSCVPAEDEIETVVNALRDNDIKEWIANEDIDGELQYFVMNTILRTALFSWKRTDLLEKLATSIVYERFWRMFQRLNKDVG